MSKQLMLMLAPAILLGGCGTVNRGMESAHQPVVSRSDYALDVIAEGGSLSVGESRRLAGWLASLRLGYGDRISIDDGSDDNYNAGLREAVATEAARYGMLLSDDAPVTTGAIAPGTARIIVSRMKAGVPGCPDQSRVSGIEFNSNTWSNYGCAVNSNLAAMVARPEDLVRGQPGAPVTDAAVSYKAIDTMRKATPTGAGGLKSESTKGN
jgi:pilus assembly protein CpaD